jgi:hypothetical protein
MNAGSMMKKIVRESFGKTIVICMFMMNSVNAKGPYSGDILGRDLLVSRLGWLGHVGIGAGDNVGAPTGIVIEALNESPVIQINYISNFKLRSKYWGSKYGIGDYGNGTYNVLVEANHQRWWCPTYSYGMPYRVGQGDIKTGQPLVCGEWRCDTLVAWSFYSAGYPALLDNWIMLPINVFKTFPYFNNELTSTAPYVKPPMLTQSDKEFADITAAELNTISYDKFVMIADIPLNQETPTHIATEWRFANDKNVNIIKRGIFIDRLSMTNEQDIIPKFLKMYDETDNLEIKSKLIQGTMIFYQGHFAQIKASNDNKLLKEFYTKLLNEKLSSHDASMVLRGYIDLHSPEEVLNNLNLINNKSDGIEPNLLLGLKLTLVYKSKELERIYIPNIISMLEKSNRSDLDDMFFGIIKMGYQNLQDPQSIPQIKDYMYSVSNKYMAPALPSQKDHYLWVAKESFIQLNNAL